MIKKVPMEKIGDLMMPQIHLVQWTRPRVERTGRKMAAEFMDVF